MQNPLSSSVSGLWRQVHRGAFDPPSPQPATKWSLEMARKARSLMMKDGLYGDDAARVLGVSRRTMFRGLKAARDHDALAAGNKLAGGLGSRKL